MTEQRLKMIRAWIERHIGPMTDMQWAAFVPLLHEGKS